MEIRKAQLKEIDVIMDIYALARQFMQETGNRNQWINGYPSKDLITNDIRNEYCHVCISTDNEIVGVFYFRIGNDITYAKIYDGKWLNDKPYGVIHRLAGTGKVRGIASCCLQWCFNQCENIRVDTHQDNFIMQNILKKNGYAQCGIIYIENGTKRLAFQNSKNTDVSYKHI